MNRANFTDYDEKPADMLNYLKYYGPHFSKRLCEFAVSLMTKENGEPIKPISKDEVRNLLQSNNIKLKHDQMYDSTYIANMCKADYLGSSIVDDVHMALFIKDAVDDPDASDGQLFNRFFADMCYNGIAIDWAEML